MQELGVAGLHIPWWQGLWVREPPRSELGKRLNTDVIKALDDTMVSRRLSDLGLEIPAGDQRTPEGCARF